MAMERTSHTVYDTRYHLVWAPKYRKGNFRDDIRDFVAQSFREIVASNEYEIDVMEIAEDYVHIFLGFPSRYSISEVVQMLKGTSAREIFRKYPWVKQELWDGEFWEDGYFVCTVGDKVTKDVIRKYIKYHKKHEKSQPAVEVVLKAPPFKAGLFTSKSISRRQIVFDLRSPIKG